MKRVMGNIPENNFLIYPEQEVDSPIVCRLVQFTGRLLVNYNEYAVMILEGLNYQKWFYRLAKYLL